MIFVEFTNAWERYLRDRKRLQQLELDERCRMWSWGALDDEILWGLFTFVGPQDV